MADKSTSPNGGEYTRLYATATVYWVYGATPRRHCSCRSAVAPLSDIVSTLVVDTSSILCNSLDTNIWHVHK